MSYLFSGKKLKLFSSSKMDSWPFLKVQKMEIDLFDFTSFFGLDFFKFSGPLYGSFPKLHFFRVFSPLCLLPICVFRCTQTMWWKSPWLNVKEGCTLRQLSFWWPFDRNTSGMGNLESNVLPQSKQNFGKMMWKMCTPLRGIVFWRCSKSKKVSGQVICFKSYFKNVFI